MEALWAGRKQCCNSDTAKAGLQVACIPSHLSRTVWVGEVCLILVQLAATLRIQGYRQRQESGSLMLSFQCEVKCRMAFFVLFRLAWRTTLGSFPASWKMTILLLLYMSKSSVGICRSTVQALYKCLRGEREIFKLSLRSSSTCAAPEPLQEGFLPCGSAKPWNCQLLAHLLS